MLCHLLLCIIVEQGCAHVVPPTVEYESRHMPINGAVFDSVQV
jgi:hypothetical protein